MKIKPDNRPLYQQAEEALNQLMKGLSPGDKFPPEPALARSLGISRATLREALRNLEEKQVITRRQGVGTFYNGPRVTIDSGLETLASVDALAQRQGLHCTTTGLEVSGGAASADDAATLGLTPGAPVTIVRRVKVADGRPIAYLVDVVPQSVLAPTDLPQGFDGSVLDLLIARRDPAASHAAADITPVKAGKELGARLQVPASTVLLLLEETIYSRDGVPVDLCRSYFVPQFFQFHLLRRIAF
jgi:GntR family transcriptional regulator